VKLRKIAVWGFLIAGVLGVITGLRDTFAPGFFNVSPQVKTKADIILQFVSAASFFALAFLFRLSSQQDVNRKQ
jgi:Na+-driven multidrug efflux pump